MSKYPIFRHYLEDEDDKPYYTMNSLSFYYEDMERKQKLIESLAKSIAGYDIRLTENLESIEQEVDKRLADWDKQLETFPASVEDLLTKWTTDGTIDQVIQTALIDEKIAPVTAQLAENAKNPFRKTLSFLDMLEKGQVTKIKLIGDSITEGVGATGHISPPPNTQPIIFTNGTETHYEGDYESRCWANFFREFINTDYPGTQFINAGIGGKSAMWGNLNKADWIDESEDVLFVMLGTNDRWENLSLEAFKTDLTEFLAYADARSNLMVVMSAQPTLNDENGGYLFGQKEVDRVITEICLENGYVHISNYRGFLEQVNLKQIPLTSVLQGATQGSHPIDAGYKLMWSNIQKMLGIVDDTLNWEDDGRAIVRVLGETLSIGTSVTSYKADAYTIALVSPSHTDIASFPEAKTGRWVTFRTSGSDVYSYQEYHIYNSNNRYYRYWTGSAWSTWSASNVTLYPGWAATASTPITVYPKDSITISIYASSHADKANFPEANGGTLITYRTSEGDAFSYQEYHVYQTNRVYKRHCQTNGVWSAWSRISGTFTLSTAQRTALSSSGASVGDMVYDYTLVKPLWIKTLNPITWVDATGTTV